MTGPAKFQAGAVLPKAGKIVQALGLAICMTDVQMAGGQQ